MAGSTIWRKVMSDSNIDRVWSMLSEIPVAMVVTDTANGEHLRARPMAVRPVPEEGAIYFLTDVGAPKSAEIERDHEICLALADNEKHKYLSITGRAEIIDDRDRVKQIWSIYDKAFWSNADDPRIRILRVWPENAEYWEGAGAVATAVKLVAASVSGRRVSLGRNEKVGFDQ